MRLRWLHYFYSIWQQLLCLLSHSYNPITYNPPPITFRFFPAGGAGALSPVLISYGVSSPSSIKVLPSNAISKTERDYFCSRPEWLPLEKKLFQRNAILFSNVWTSFFQQVVLKETFYLCKWIVGLFEFARYHITLVLKQLKRSYIKTSIYRI